MACETLPLPASSPGQNVYITVCRFGTPGTERKAYIQASTHADEVPAALTAMHLRRLLEDAERAGRIRGEIVLVPAANPPGFAQALLGHHMGRHHLPSGRNFNRFWPDATQAVFAVRESFGEDPVANAARVRHIVSETLAALQANAADEHLKLMLMRLAHDADIVLDLHTDDDADMHLYVDPDHWPGLADLAGLLDAKVVMFARGSGGNAFEETVAAPFVALREAGIPCELPVTVTVELRGRLDVDDALAARDARALFDFLILRGIIEGEAEAPEFSGIAAPFEATEPVRAPAGGICVFLKARGAHVEAGEVIAEIADPVADVRTPVRTRATGRLFTRCLHRLVHAGDVIAKVQGTAPLPGRRKGQLMTD